MDTDPDPQHWILDTEQKRMRSYSRWGVRPCIQTKFNSADRANVLLSYRTGFKNSLFRHYMYLLEITYRILWKLNCMQRYFGAGSGSVSFGPSRISSYL